MSKTSEQKYIRSSSFTMALFFTVLLGLSIVILAVVINQFNNSSLVREVGEQIDTDTTALKKWLLLMPERDVSDVLQTIKDTGSHSQYSHLSEDGKLLFGDINPKENGFRLLTEGILLFDSASPENIQYAAKVFTLEDDTRVLVIRDVTDAMSSRSKMRWLGLIIISLMMIVVLTSFYLSAYVVRLINQIGNTARHIIDTRDLSQRIDVHQRWDDLSNLAKILNELLEGTESLMQGVRQVSDNIAHDLRTPLTRMRNQLETLRQDIVESDSPEFTESVDVLLNEADQLLGVFTALLRIANLEAGKQALDLQLFCLSDLMDDVTDLYEPLAEEKNISLELSTDKLYIKGDKHLLFQTVANMVDNAIKYTPSGGRVFLGCQDIGEKQIAESKGNAEKYVRIWVADTGPGLSEEDYDKVFRRFYRADHSRTTVGNGLGLSFVKAVILRHEGRLSLSANDPGLRVEILLPART